MEKTKEEFTLFIREAMLNKKSDAYIQLYQFLVGCFVRVDKDLNGRILFENFDDLITTAAALPRKYGYAPTNDEMYPNEDTCRSARVKMFGQITNNSKDADWITLEQWLAFSLKHIKLKVKSLPKDILTGEKANKKEFLDMIQKAVDRTSPEYRRLYFFLLKCFVDADKDHDGCINAAEFDAMIEVAAAAPRKVGLAPANKSMYKNDAERLERRTTQFNAMDLNKNGTISFDEWLRYAVEHITAKVNSLHATTNGKANGVSNDQANGNANGVGLANGNRKVKATNESPELESRSHSCIIL